ncbi:hypothetical protein [Streptomyces sp. NPDC008317]|uniref:hypothetical protein n=1 Tax=Streptomyces sp. NPDC008317 TaxID=3364827 RepID=UPI0036E578AA
MISEPELTGGGPHERGEPDYGVLGTPDAADTADGPGASGRTADLVVDFEGGPPPPPAAASRVRPPWVWVLGAAVVTSALWAGGLFVYDRGHSDLPDLHGYHIADSPCEGPTLQPLTAAVRANSPGKLSVETPETSSPAMQHLGPALDQVACDFSTQAPYARGATMSYIVAVAVDLHKETDPRVEFEDQVRMMTGSLQAASEVSSVPGLGDQAYFLTRSDEGQELKILHGGAVISLTLNAYSDVNVSEDTINGLDGGGYPLSPDLVQYQPALIETARNIMGVLRK